jgi:hypothetical protein
MKESSYHNPRMATYCQEVRKLEDKFDGLVLNHILDGSTRQPTS